MIDLLLPQGMILRLVKGATQKQRHPVVRVMMTGC